MKYFKRKIFFIPFLQDKNNLHENLPLVMINNTAIKRKKRTQFPSVFLKSPSVFLNEKRLWKPQIDTICSKISQTFDAL